jgi:hypothetical protein
MPSLDGDSERTSKLRGRRIELKNLPFPFRVLMLSCRSSNVDIVSVVTGRLCGDDLLPNRPGHWRYLDLGSIQIRHRQVVQIWARRKAPARGSHKWRWWATDAARIGHEFGRDRARSYTGAQI